MSPLEIALIVMVVMFIIGMPIYMCEFSFQVQGLGATH